MCIPLKNFNSHELCYPYLMGSTTYRVISLLSYIKVNHQASSLSFIFVGAEQYIVYWDISVQKTF